MTTAVHGLRTGLSISGPGDEEIADLFEHEGYGLEPFDSMEDNATLIAAAPDMLYTLEGVKNRHEYNHTDNTEEYKVVCAMIRKARGQ